MGFESQLSFQCTIVPREYLMGLISRFDSTTCTLRVNGSSFLLITMEDVSKVLGAGQDVPNVVPEEDINIIARYHKISLKLLTTAVIIEEPSLVFQMSVLVFFLASFLCLTTKNACSVRLLAAISVVAHAIG